MKVQGKVWGVTRAIFDKNNVEVHHLNILKGGYCSKHCHETKFNRFVVRHGRLRVITWRDYGHEVLTDETILTAGQECTVAPKDFHMFEALEDTECLEIYWVELSAADIKRVNNGGLFRDEDCKR